MQTRIPAIPDMRVFTTSFTMPSNYDHTGPLVDNTFGFPSGYNANGLGIFYNQSNGEMGFVVHRQNGQVRFSNNISANAPVHVILVYNL